MAIVVTNFNNNLLVAEAQSDEKQGLKDYVAYVADFYNLSYQDMDRVIECESSYNQNSSNPKSSAKGIAQFLDGSFKWFAGMYEDEKGRKLDRNSAKDNIALMGYSWSKGYKYHWSCK